MNILVFGLLLLLSTIDLMMWRHLAFRISILLWEQAVEHSIIDRSPQKNDAYLLTSTTLHSA